MIGHRPRRCPLRQPRIWLWALLVILPGHILVAYALHLHKAGTLLGCPVPHAMRVSLVPPQPQPLAQPLITPLPALMSQKILPPKPSTHRPAPAPRKNRPTTVARTQGPAMALRAQPPAAAAAPEDAKPAASPAPTTMGVRALGFFSTPRPPVYPALSRARNEEGTAHILALIAPQSRTPLEVKLERSSGYPRLDNAALGAVSQWRFNSPATTVWVRIPVKFALTD